MGFFSTQQVVAAKGSKRAEDFYRELGCRACPLNHAPLRHPKIKPTGTKKPVVYIMGEAAGEQEDRKGKQFVGPSGQFLRARIPDKWEPYIRWNNVLRCHPPDNRDPEHIEIEACRLQNIRDIEESAPDAVFGFGNFPLKWVLGQTGIEKWRGRRIPVRIGKHKCWFYPMLHPSGILRSLERYPHSKEEHVFELDLKRAFADLDRLPVPDPHDEARARAGIDTIQRYSSADLDRIVTFLRKASKAEAAGLDWETTGLRPYRPKSRILTASVSEGGKTLAFPIDHPEARWTLSQRDLLWGEVLAFLRAPVRKIAFNSAFELEWVGGMFGREVVWASLWEDPVVQTAILDERIGSKPDWEREIQDTSCLGLGFVSLNRVGLNIKSLSDVDTEHMIDEPLEKILPYNGMDSKYCEELFYLQRDLLQDEGLEDLYNFHMERIPTVVLTQIKGIPVDFDVADELHADLTQQVETVEKKFAVDPHVAAFRKTFRKDFNPGSDPDCKKMFRDVVKSKAGVGKLGKYSVTKKVLAKIDAPIAQLVLDWREPSKLLSTYTWPHGHKYIYPDGHLHPILNTLIAETGRLSSEQPNSQNFPTRTVEGKRVRKQVKAPPGHVIVKPDYGQIEARGIAMTFRDKVFVQALWEGYDVHMEWAERIAKRRPEVLDKYSSEKSPIKALRQAAKSGWVFALFFDARQSTCEAFFGLPEGSLTKEYNEFWNTFSETKKGQDELKKFYAKHGYVENLFGRRRRAPISGNQLVNAPIQSLASDIVIDAMNGLSALARDDWYFQPIMNVHDDLTSIYPEKNLDQYVEKMLDVLLGLDYPFLNVPLSVDISVGKNLCDVKEIGTFDSRTWGK